mgnify:CR=1 FL=1
MIFLSVPTYDVQATLRLDTSVQNPYQGKRRGSVTATLDGGVYPYDGGFSIADQTLNASLKRPSKAVLVSLSYLVAYYSQQVLCCESGAFLGILSFAVNKDILSISFRIIKRLN